MRSHALTLLIAVLALAAAPAAHARELQLTVYLHEFERGLHLLPESINAEVGDILTVQVINQGESPHNLLFCGDGTNVFEKCDDKWAFTPLLEANGTATLTVALEKAGTFDYYCSIPGHKGLGMSGVLNVKGPAAQQDTPGLPLALIAVALAVAILLRRPRA